MTALRETSAVNAIKHKFRMYYNATSRIKEQFYAYMQRFEEMYKFLACTWDIEVKKLMSDSPASKKAKKKNTMLKKLNNLNDDIKK